MTFGSLFAGIGGMDLGLERAGMTCKWQVEINPYCRKVLAKHWPDVPKHDDVMTFPPTQPEDWTVDLICGGFPCQDVSRIGKRAGIEGERSGLWTEYDRVVRTLRPRFVLVENVMGILARGINTVLGDLASLGYDTEWNCVPASAVGAPHSRQRIFVVAHRVGDGLEISEQARSTAGAVKRSDRDASGLDTVRVLRELPLHYSWGTCPRLRVSGNRGMVHEPIPGSTSWEAESPVCRVVHGVPDRMDRLRGLGNAVVPQVAQWIGQRIMETSS
jgi:DNA (cytosine-5)-methyltransferase 1